MTTPDEPHWYPAVPDPEYAAADTAALHTSAKPPRGYRFGAASGFAAAVLLGAIGVGAYFGINALTVVNKPNPFTLTGTLQLNSDSITTSGLPIGYKCAGEGGYTDIGPGTALTVSDETGKLLAKGAIESSYGQSGACTLTFKIYNVPGGATFYKVEVSHRGQMSYTEAEAKAGIDLSLGNSAPSPTATPTPAPTASVAPAQPATSIPGDGTYRVGVDIQPGVYRSQGAESCYWARLSGLSGSSNDIIANNGAAGPQVVQIAPSDAAFETRRCATWNLVSAANTAPSAPPAAIPTTAQPTEPVPDTEYASLYALRAQANTDRPFVSGQLADRWVPQLSSERPGRAADGTFWTNATIWQEYLQLRAQYPGISLLWSGDWSTFSAPDFWVTVVGITFPDSGGALDWCTSHNRDRNHCYAKIVSTTHPIDGSTAR